MGNDLAWEVFLLIDQTPNHFTWVLVIACYSRNNIASNFLGGEGLPVFQASRWSG